MQNEENKNMNELDDLLRKSSLSDEKLFKENAPLLERSVFNEEHNSIPFYQKGEKIVKKLEKEFSQPNKDFNHKKWWLIAATIVILAGLSFILSKIINNEPVYKEIATTTVTKSKVTLPDNTTVWLNKNSKLTFNQKFPKREVTLIGEAFFDVTKNPDSPFIINSGNAEIKVLGTSFNVKQTPEETEVTVVTGKVILAQKEKENQKTKLLKAGYKGVFQEQSNKIKSEPNTNKNFLAWKTNTLIFERTPFRDVIKAISEFYGKEIILNDQGVGNCTINSTYKDQSFEEVLNEFKLILNIEYNYQGNTVIITGEPC